MLNHMGMCRKKSYLLDNNYQWDMGIECSHKYLWDNNIQLDMESLQYFQQDNKSLLDIHLQNHLGTDKNMLLDKKYLVDMLH